MKLSALTLVLFALPLLTACPKSKSRIPDVMTKRIVDYELNQFDADARLYNEAIDRNLPEQARRIRDRVVHRLKRNIDANYHEFEEQLFTGRASANILFDIIDFGAGVAGTITNGERAKEIISAALTGFRGGRKSIDENLFRERTTAVIISQMQASRAHIETGILRNLNEKPADDYTLDAALGDLINYFYAGTLQKGLQDLAQQTAQSAIDEKRNAAFVRERGRRNVTRAEADRAVEIGEFIEQLRRDALEAPVNPERRDQALTVVRHAINQLTGSEPNDTATPNELFEQLKLAMRNAGHDPDGGVERIRKALGMP